MAKTISRSTFPKNIIPFAEMMAIILVCPLLFGLGDAVAAQPVTISPDDIVSRIFLGEAYPSGHVYVQRAMTSGKNIAWPQELNIQGMRDSIVPVGAAKAVLLRKVLNEYPPGAEGLDEDADFNHNKMCGWKYPLSTEHRKAESDYFDTISDYCERDPELGLYKATFPINEARNIVATSGAIVLGKPDYSMKGNPRPITKAEAIKVEKEKTKASATEDECETRQSFIDSAKQLSTFPVLNTHYTLRVSTYSDPGCAGHLMVIYIIDVIEKGNLKKSFSVLRYLGPI